MPRLVPPIEILNTVCPYFTMFPLSLPLRLLSDRRDQHGWVLDPFCGRGTSNYAARIKGLPTIGIDSSPVAAAITAAKLVSTSPARIYRACVKMLETAPYDIEIPTGRFWQLCYEEENLIDLCRLRASLLNKCDTPTRIALRALLLGLLHGPRNKGKPSYVSNQSPRTYAPKPRYVVKFWKQKGLRPQHVDIADLVRRKAERFFSSPPPAVEHRVYCADSRAFDFGKLGRIFSDVVCSPPYFGMASYVPDQWLRYWFLGGPPDVVYGQDADQFSHGSSEEFSMQLAKVWAGVADACYDGASMVIRFGGVPKRRACPRDILRDSIELAGAGWRIITAKSAGIASPERRQANQFRDAAPAPVEEIDYYLRLG